MTARVPIECPGLPSAAALRIGQPMTGGMNQALVDYLAHLLGAELSVVHHMVFGITESATATWRFQYRAHPNVRALMIQVVPMGYTSGTSGTVSVASAETDTPITIYQADVVSAPESIHRPVSFVRPVTADTLQEITYSTTNLRLHTVSAWEIPRARLASPQELLEGSFADAGRRITDSTTRGFQTLINRIISARQDTRRHPISHFTNAGKTTTFGGSANPTAYQYVWGSAVAGDGFSTRTRDVGGAGVLVTPCRIQVYASAVGASTFDVRIATTAAGSPYTIAGLAAVGWSPANPGLAIDVDDGTDTVTVEARRTAGAGELTLNGCCAYEDLP